MQSHGSTLSANYTKIANELLERTDIDLAAKSLLGYFLMRKGWRRADIKSLSAKFGESQDKISKWMRQLAQGGYLIRRKVRDAKGQWRTMIHAFASPHELPGADMSSTTMDKLAAQSSSHFPSLGQPSLADPSFPPSGDKTGDKTPLTPVAAPEPAGPGKAGEDSTMSEGQAVLSAALHEIGQRDKRLRLNVLQMMSLLPLVAAWHENGATDAQIVHACTWELPETIAHAGKLLGYRLRTRLPQKAAQGPVAPPVAEVLVRPVQKDGECAECGRPMIRSCTHCAGADDGQPEFLVASRTRGIGLARKLLAQRGIGKAA